MSDYAAEAAVVAKAIDGAVMVIDTREGDLQHDYYRPASMQRLRAGVDARRQDRRVGSRHRQLLAQRVSQGSARRALDRDLRQLRRPRAEPRSSSTRICSRRAFRMRACATARR